MPASPAVRYFLSALVVAIAGWLVDTYLPLAGAAHILAVLCYIAAAVMVLLGVLTLLRGGPVV